MTIINYVKGVNEGFTPSLWDQLVNEALVDSRIWPCRHKVDPKLARTVLDFEE